MNNNTYNEDNRISYMQMIQDNISRMSTSSAIFKGFTSTIVAGVASLSFNSINTFVLILSFLPVILFVVLDVYFLQLERKYRALYDLVRKGDHKVDFDLKPPIIQELKGSYPEVKITSCLNSISIKFFYGPNIIICLIIVFMKCKGII